MNHARSLPVVVGKVRSLPVVVGKVCEHHIGKALNSAANL